MITLVPVAMLPARSVIDDPIIVTLSPGSTVGREELADKVTVNFVPSTFQPEPPKAPDPSLKEWELESIKVLSMVEVFTVGLVVDSEKFNSTLSPASLAEVPPVFLPTAEVSVGP